MRALLAAAALIASVAAVPAQAHPENRWHWSTAAAEYQLTTSFRAQNALRATSVDYAECEPQGTRIRSSSGRQWLYKHFECLIRFTRTEEECDSYSCYDQPYEYEAVRILHVTGRFTFALATA